MVETNRYIGIIMAVNSDKIIDYFSYLNIHMLFVPEEGESKGLAVLLSYTDSHGQRSNLMFEEIKRRISQNQNRVEINLDKPLCSSKTQEYQIQGLLKFLDNEK